MKKKNKIILYSLFVIIVFFAFYSVFNYKSKTIDNEFVLSDTSTVTKIFLVDKNNNSVTLNKKGSDWFLQNNEPALNENVNLILKTMMLIDIKYPISKSSYNNNVRRLAASNTKVEIYQNEPLIDLFGWKLFVKERLTKTFYVGGPTMDNLGTVMKMEDDDNLYVTYIPGFKGYLSERFSAKIADWKSHIIFQYNISQIASVKVEFPEEPKESYQIDNENNVSFTLTQLMGNVPIPSYDTIRVLELLASFSKISYESYLDDMPKQRIDSLTSNIPFKVVTLTTKLGEKKVLKMYRRFNTEQLLDIDGNPFKYDVDRMYGFYSEEKHPLSIQFFVADNITRNLSFLTGLTDIQSNLKTIL